MHEVREKDRGSNSHVQTLFPSPGLHRAVLPAHPWILGSFLKFLSRQAECLSVSLPNKQKGLDARAPSNVEGASMFSVTKYPKL